MKRNKIFLLSFLVIILIFSFLVRASAQQDCYQELEITETKTGSGVEFELVEKNNVEGDYSNFVREYSPFLGSDYVLNTYDLHDNLVSRYALSSARFIFYDTLDFEKGEEDALGGYIDEKNSAVLYSIIPCDEEIGKISISSDHLTVAGDEDFLISGPNIVSINKNNFEERGGTVIYNFRYDNMFPELEGIPTIEEVNCGYNDVSGEIGNPYHESINPPHCTDPLRGTPSECYVECFYDESVPIGDYVMTVKISNDEKFAETDIPIEIYEVSEPDAVNLSTGIIDCCFHDKAQGSFSWQYYDEDGKEQGLNPSSRIQISEESDFSTLLDGCGSKCDVSINNIKCDDQSGKECSYVPQNRVFEWNKNYYWRVKVQDNTGEESDWEYSPNTALIDEEGYPSGPPTETALPGTSFNPGNPWPWPAFNYEVI
ncbi:MAG: hypothetical protein ABEK36_02465, partial [Candidatus Aenigmatarchaeota archaeon]